MPSTDKNKKRSLLLCLLFSMALFAPLINASIDNNKARKSTPIGNKEKIILASLYSAYLVGHLTYSYLEHIYPQVAQQVKALLGSVGPTLEEVISTIDMLIPFSFTWIFEPLKQQGAHSRQANDKRPSFRYSYTYTNNSAKTNTSGYQRTRSSHYTPTDTKNIKNYYTILGVCKNDTKETITKAYRREARKYHPDKNKDSGAEDRFKEINEAYQILSDINKKHEYDQKLF